MSVDVTTPRLVASVRGDGLPATPVQDALALRKVLSTFATGVTVVTAVGGLGGPCGMTVNSFTSVSLDPPLVLFCVKRGARVHGAIRDAGTFAVSVLSARQQTAARYFADRSRPRGPGEFSAVDAESGQHTGAPILNGALAWLECRLAADHDGGDHSIVVGEVLAAHIGQHADPLLFYRGAFHRLGPADTRDA
jgi:flavin reductase